MPKFKAKYISVSEVEIEATDAKEAHLKAEEMNDYYIESNARGWEVDSVEEVQPGYFDEVAKKIDAMTDEEFMDTLNASGLEKCPVVESE